MATKHPIGGVDEARALGLKLKKTMTCSDPDNPANGEACPLFHLCDSPCKGLPGVVSWKDKDGKPCRWDAEGATRSGPGPITFGVELLKPKLGTDDFIPVNTTFDCFHFIQQREQARANGGDAQVIAIEGQTIMVAGSVRRVVPDPSGGKPQVFEDDGPVPLKIKPFPRPMERREFRDRALNAQKVAEGQNEARQRKIERFREQFGQGGPVDGAGAGDTAKPAGGRGATRG